MGIASWKSRFLQIFNRGGNQSRQKNGPSEVKSFKVQQEKEAAFDTRDRGIQTIPLDRIVGSVGRYKDFDNSFRFKQNIPSERLQRIRVAMREGRPMKPVELFQIKDEYYVSDGNHRISAAKELGHNEILARIVEFIPSEDTLDGLLYRERAEFADLTQLPAEITLTEVSQYAFLLEQISDHQVYLEREQGHPVEFQEAALDWYRTIYRPLVSIIKRGRLVDLFPGRTVADLYAYITLHHWKQSRRRHYGVGINKLIEQNMEEFRKKMAELKSVEYPEMKQSITVFILMNLQTGKEMKLIEKLYALEEVKEIYSVHGDVDLLVKAELTRDLLSSDAETISQFVHEKVRQLQGIISTNTLIPGFSKTKAQTTDPNDSSDSK
jgi:DNA-binding Lrp family transcriptional regulator